MPSTVLLLRSLIVWMSTIVSSLLFLPIPTSNCFVVRRIIHYNSHCIRRPPNHVISFVRQQRKQFSGYYRTKSSTSLAMMSTTTSTSSNSKMGEQQQEQRHIDNNSNNDKLLPTTKIRIAFSHIHLYVDRVFDLDVYQTLENQLNEFYSATTTTTSNDKEQQRELWKSIVHRTTSSTIGSPLPEEPPYIPQNRDIVQQLMVGFGFRITGAHYDDKNSGTRTVLVTSRDANGVQYLITSSGATETETTITAANRHHDNENIETKKMTTDVLHSSNVRRFFNSHSSRQGIGVLGFIVNDVAAIYERYKSLHPNLLVQQYFDGTVDNDETASGAPRILEVYAFYNNTLNNNYDNDDNNNNNDNNKQQLPNHEREPDTGTILRFIEVTDNSDAINNRDDAATKTTTSLLLHDLLGLQEMDATFMDPTSQAAYCDHWVSNVYDRTEFLDTLYDTLDFTPKVDFNAGVVAAGEAQIESTVTGNTITVVPATSPAVATTAATNVGTPPEEDTTLALNSRRNKILMDQNQVFLPINNALSEVGHVYGFLNELGQGIQHIASRVSILVDFVQRCNDYRMITNEGFSFLRIPRSYYGVLTKQQLMDGIHGDGTETVSKECANEIIAVLRRAGSLTNDFAVSLDLSREDINLALESNMKNELMKTEYLSKRDVVLDVIMRSRYCNLYSLLKDQVSEQQYIGIVRNQILVDIQGNDLLYQIFTSNILQRNPGEEAPFLEFIQRVCSSKGVVKPGCGGFGIRNFLTLFLSIEVSKAMQEVTDSIEDGDFERQQYAQSMVDTFTKQLNEANPILTAISDAMTDEGSFKENMIACLERNQLEEASIWESRMKEAAKEKQKGNMALMECSSRYKAMMKSIRETRQTPVARA